jgi:hypothetical protein
MRAYTFDSTTCRALDRLLEDPVALNLLIPAPTLSEILHPIKDEPLDSHDLKPGDYTVLYDAGGVTQLPVGSPKDWAMQTKKSDWNLLMDALVAAQNEAQANKVLRIAKDLGKLNRRVRRKTETKIRQTLAALPARRTVANASRVAEALILLGVAALNQRSATKNERSQKIELARSSQSHDGEGEVERPRGKASKAIAAGAIRGGPRARRVSQVGGVQNSVLQA